MIVAGCDVGSLTSKAVVMIMENGSSCIVGASIIRSRTNPHVISEKALNEAMEKAGINRSRVECCVGTGYGRERMPFTDESASEIKCHAKGAHWLLPSARTVIDIGGQDCKAIQLDEKGNVIEFSTNDKCASGTGRFMEVMAKVLNIDLAELSSLSGKSTSPLTLASTCTVWAQADVINHLNSGMPIEDIAAGINTAMAGRVATLVSGLGLHDDVTMTGGGAKNLGLVQTLEHIIGRGIKKIRKSDPQLAGAIGAAIVAGELAKNQ